MPQGASPSQHLNLIRASFHAHDALDTSSRFYFSQTILDQSRAKYLFHACFPAKTWVTSNAMQASRKPSDGPHGLPSPMQAPSDAYKLQKCMCLRDSVPHAVSACLTGFRRLADQGLVWPSYGEPTGFTNNILHDCTAVWVSLGNCTAVWLTAVKRDTFVLPLFVHCIPSCLPDQDLAWQL